MITFIRCVVLFSLVSSLIIIDFQISAFMCLPLPIAKYIIPPRNIEVVTNKVHLNDEFRKIDRDGTNDKNYAPYDELAEANNAQASNPSPKTGKNRKGKSKTKAESKQTADENGKGKAKVDKRRKNKNSGNHVPKGLSSIA